MAIVDLRRCGFSVIVGLMLISRVKLERRVIIPFSFPSPILVGERAIANCGTRGGDVTQFQWLKNGEILRDGSKVAITSTKYLSALSIEKLEITDSGNYTCLITMKNGLERYTTKLHVLAPPEWITVSKDKVAYVGSNASIECLSSGVPKPTVTWEFSPRSSPNIYKVVRPKGDHEGDHKLTLVNVKEGDGGEYRCTSNNSVGAPLIKIINFNVLSKSPLTGTIARPTPWVGGAMGSTENTSPKSLPKESLKREGSLFAQR